MSKYTAYYHIVFCTKERKMTIPLELKEDIYRVIWKILTDNNCKLLRIGGIQNHIHMLINLHPSIALSALMQKIKGATSSWMHTDPRFTLFEGWARDYFACTLSLENKDAVIEYIKNQETHHLTNPLDDEFRRLYRYAGLNYDTRDMN